MGAYNSILIQQWQHIWTLKKFQFGNPDIHDGFQFFFRTKTNYIVIYAKQCADYENDAFFYIDVLVVSDGVFAVHISPL